MCLKWSVCMHSISVGGHDSQHESFLLPASALIFHRSFILHNIHIITALSQMQDYSCDFQNESTLARCTSIYWVKFTGFLFRFSIYRTYVGGLHTFLYWSYKLCQYTVELLSLLWNVVICHPAVRYITS